MLTILGVSFDVFAIAKEYPENSIERQLVNKMFVSDKKYRYDNLNQLKFELTLRKEIVNSAIDLNGSELSFANFKNSKCNSEYWHRMANGGFMMAEGVKANEAIDDIYINGNKYATECATAIMIVYYRALLTVYGNELFNKLFSKIYLMGWYVTEPLLAEVNTIDPSVDILLGDRGYFNNPDFNPATPEWGGENIIVLPDSMYYGHGVGITTADEIIRILNSMRKVNATQSAYFTYSVGYPNFKNLSDIYYTYTSS